jgi:hypothetical protein
MVEAFQRCPSTLNLSPMMLILTPLFHRATILFIKLTRLKRKQSIRAITTHQNNRLQENETEVVGMLNKINNKVGLKLQNHKEPVKDKEKSLHNLSIKLAITPDKKTGMLAVCLPMIATTPQEKLSQ